MLENMEYFPIFLHNSTDAFHSSHMNTGESQVLSVILIKVHLGEIAHDCDLLESMCIKHIKYRTFIMLLSTAYLQYHITVAAMIIYNLFIHLTRIGFLALCLCRFSHSHFTFHIYLKTVAGLQLGTLLQ